MNREIPDPLPPDSLPEPVAPPGPGDPEVWESRIRGLMAEAEPTLARYRVGRRPWWTAFGQNWQPATVGALAAAAGLILALGLGSLRRAPVPEHDLVLAVAASDGEPAALWAVMGAEADPVLALIALEGE